MEYVFISHLKTVLSLSPAGDLIHESAESAALNLRCNEAGNPRSERSFTVERLANGKGFGLKSNEGYLCAETGGKINVRPHCSEWETFTLESIDTVGRQENAAVPGLPRKPRHINISRIIHQTYTADKIPEQVLGNVDALRRLNPGWEYRYWSDKDRHDFIYHYFGWDILRSYLRINPRYGAARADLFRYLCVYQLGGVYLDIKSGSRVPLDSIIRPDDQYLLSHWQNQPGEAFAGWGQNPDLGAIRCGEYQQWHVIGVAGHPFLEQVLLSVLRNIARYSVRENGVGARAVIRLAGPVPYTLAIYSVLDRHPHRFFDAHADGLIFHAAPRPMNQSGGYRDQNTPLVF